MASTSFSLGPYWDEFIKKQVAEGRYGTGSEVVREALRRMEIETEKFYKLKAEIDEAIRQADAGETVDGPTFMAELSRQIEERE
ncbi:MAG: type II toxin-antitoxin system ParD family antitoxin [Pseudomonadota bacterium]